VAFYFVGFPASANNVPRLQSVFGSALRPQRLGPRHEVPDAITVDTVDYLIEAENEADLRQKLDEALGPLPARDMGVDYLGETYP
jgi:hypothetical protein